MRGMMMIELLIALAVFTLSMSAVVMLRAADSAAPTDLAREREAREIAEAMLERVRAESPYDFASVISASMSAETLSVTDYSACLKQAVASVNYGRTSGIALATTLKTLIASLPELVALGTDCGTGIPPGTIENLSAPVSISVASTTALDELDGTAYVGTSAPPYLAIVENTDGTMLSREAFSNGFTLAAPPNAVDAVAVRDTSGTTRRYVYAALAATSSQLVVIEVTDPAAPVITVVRSLSNVDSAGSFPQGWRVRYYGKRLYVVTRETAGRELHIFDAEDPSLPFELGSGIELGITVNDIAIRDERGKRYLFAACARDGGELAAYDVSDPARAGAALELSILRTDLPGNQDGLALALNGSRLYLGRATVTNGPELYAFDATHPEGGLVRLGTAETTSSVAGLAAWGSFVFALTKRSGKEMQVWNVHDASAMALAATATIQSPSGIDVGSGALFSTGAAVFSSYALSL